MTFDPTKPVRTRDGRPAHISEVVPPGVDVFGRRFVGRYIDSDGQWYVCAWFEDGRVLRSNERGYDLVNAEPEMVVNVMRDDNGYTYAGAIHPDVATALCQHNRDNRIGTYRLVRVEGKP